MARKIKLTRHVKSLIGKSNTETRVMMTNPKRRITLYREVFFKKKKYYRTHFFKKVQNRKHKSHIYFNCGKDDHYVRKCLEKRRAIKLI